MGGIVKKRRLIGALGALAAVGALVLALTAGGADGGTFPGANGKIAYESDGGNIVVMNPDGSNKTPLGTGSSASFSADGERIAFADEGAVTPVNQIWTMDADGSNRFQVTNSGADDPSISADGQRIVYTGFDGSDSEIFAVPAAGGAPQPLTSNSDPDAEPAFSPDDQRVAFIRNDGTDSEIWSMAADGSDQVQLTDDALDDSDPIWFPDGGKIVYTHDDGSDTELFTMDADGSNQQPLTDNAFSDEDPDISPDGQIAAYTSDTSGSKEIYRIGTDGSNPQPVATAPPIAEDPTWQALNAPLCELSGRKKQKSKKAITLTVGCVNENATVTVKGKLKVPKAKRGGRKSAVAAGSKTFSLAAKTVAVDLAQPVNVKLKFPNRARKALKKATKAGKSAKAKITGLAGDDLGQAAATNGLKVKVKSKNKK